MDDALRFPPDVLEEAARSVFRASGSPEEEAALIARRLVGASLAGHDSHGILRVHHYMNQLRDGLIRPAARPEVIRDNGATAQVSGNRGYGQVVAHFGMREAVARARRHGVAGVGLTDLTHVGRLADYAIAGAREGMVCLVFTATGGSDAVVAPFGGAKGRLSTNPFAAGFPSAREFPVVLDMATSAVAFGKLRAARDAGLRMPEGMLQDAEGRATSDPAAGFEGGSLLPFGGAQGHKGYLMAFLVEAMGALLTGGGFQGREGDARFNNCSFMIALDVAAFMPLERFHADLDRLVEHLRATPARPGETVLYPGEFEERNERERRRDGIPLPPRTVANLQSELDRFGIGLQLKSRALGGE